MFKPTAREKQRTYQLRVIALPYYCDVKLTSQRTPQRHADIQPPQIMLGIHTVPRSQVRQRLNGRDRRVHPLCL